MCMYKKITDRFKILFFVLIILSGIGMAQSGSDQNVKWLAEPQFDSAKSFDEGVALVYSKGAYDYIDKNGKVLCGFRYSYMEKFSEGMAAVHDSTGKYGFIDKSGKVVIPLDFTNAKNFSDGLARVTGGGQYINSRGETVFKTKDLYSHGDFVEGLAMVQDYTYKYGFIDKTGKQVIPVQFSDARNFCEGRAAVKINEKWGFISADGRVVVKPEYDSLEHFTGGVSIAQRDGKYGLIDKSGKLIAPFKYDQMLEFSEGLLRAEKDGKIGFLDRKGREVIRAQFDNAQNFSEGLSNIEINKKEGFIDKTGKIVIDSRFDEVLKFREGMARIIVNKKYGFIDRTGRVVVEPQYEIASDYFEGLACVQVGYKWGYIDKTGKIVINPQFDQAEDFSEGAALVKVDLKWGYILNPLKAVEQENSLKQGGSPVGDVKSLSGIEVIIGGKDIGEAVMMGDKLSIYSGDNIVILKATFPMMTTVKCSALSGDIKYIKPGLKVYRYKARKKTEE